jgi:hypothetical protein
MEILQIFGISVCYLLVLWVVVSKLFSKYYL